MWGRTSHTQSWGLKIMNTICLTSYLSFRCMCALFPLPAFLLMVGNMDVSSSELSCLVEVSGEDFDKLGLNHLPAIGLLHPGKEQDSGMNSPAPNHVVGFTKEQLFSRKGELFSAWRDSVGFMTALEESHG